MSRSRKKNPWVCDRNPWMKNYANRRVRRTKPRLDNLEDWISPIPEYRGYARYTCPWDICDWKWTYGTEAEYVEHQRRFQEEWIMKYPNTRRADETEADWRREWRKYYSGK